MVALAYTPGHRSFAPGILVMPSTDVAFLGAGTTLHAYRLSPHVEALWRDEAMAPFWGWRQHGSTVVMSAELELAASDIDRTMLWSRVVEPPWSYSVEDQRLTLDVMGTVTTFDLRRGT